MGFWESLRITFLAQRSDIAVLEAAADRRDGRATDPAAGLTVRSHPSDWLTALGSFVVELDRCLAWVTWHLPEGGASTGDAVEAMLAAARELRAFVADHVDEVPPKLDTLFSRSDVLADRWIRVAEDWMWAHDTAILTDAFRDLGPRWLGIGEEIRARWQMPVDRTDPFADGF
jgi:hypothetical protein